MPLAGAHAGGDFRFPPEPAYVTPQAIAIPEYPTWYLRGDIGWGFAESFDLNQTGTTFVNPEAEDTFTIGGGLGYFFSDNVRGDVTVDYRFDADVTGINTTTSTLQTTDLSSTVVLGSLYYDIRGRDKFSPYIGGGLGVSFNESNSSESRRADFAAAAMAGISYRMQDNILLDAGYRFLYLGDARTDAAIPLELEEITAHEIRVGVRYEFQ